MNKFFQNEIASGDFLASCNAKVTETITQGIVQLTDVVKIIIETFAITW